MWTAEEIKEYGQRYREKNKERIKTARALKRQEAKEYYRLWYAEHGPRKRTVAAYEATKKWCRENKEKSSAARKVQYAVRVGKLVRPTKCEWCLKEGKVCGHHEDYSKPLQVIWLCHSCHKGWHEVSKRVIVQTSSACA